MPEVISVSYALTHLPANTKDPAQLAEIKELKSQLFKDEKLIFIVSNNYVYFHQDNSRRIHMLMRADETKIEPYQVTYFEKLRKIMNEVDVKWL